MFSDYRICSLKRDSEHQPHRMCSLTIECVLSGAIVNISQRDLTAKQQFERFRLFGFRFEVGFSLVQFGLEMPEALSLWI